MTKAMEILMMHGTDIPTMMGVMETESELWHCPLPFNGDAEYHFKDGSRFERRGNRFFICGKELNMSTVLQIAHMVKKCEDDIAPDPDLIACGCGCHGDYTDHTMRMGERGIR